MKQTLTSRDKILQTKTRYVNKIKENDEKIEQINMNSKEYRVVIKECDRQLEEIEQPTLF